MLTGLDKENTMVYNANMALKKWQATVYQHKCLRCGQTWESLNPHPLRCGKCKSPYWSINKKGVKK